MSTVPTTATTDAAPEQEAADAGRDWVAWYDDLSDHERRALRDRILTATPEDVKADDELRYFFIFHVDDLAHEQPPGTRKLLEFYQVVQLLRGRDDCEEDRRKAVHFLLAAYQHYLRDNPFVH